MKNHTQSLLLASAAVLGMALAWIDSRPGWDDSGIIAGALLLAAAFVTVLGYRRPWLSGLALGIWIPLLTILRDRDLSSLLILLFPLAGAYAGLFLRRAFRRVTD